MNQRRIRSSAAWKHARIVKLRKDPLCEDPFNRHAIAGQVVPAVEVHHIVRLANKKGKAFDGSNLASLCVGCHAKISGMERAGREEETVKLFSPDARKRRKEWYG